MFLFQDIRWRPRGIPAKVILAIGLVIALPAEAATLQERTPPPEHVLPIVPPPFHFSDQAMDREHSRLVRGVDSALDASRPAMFAAQAALWAARAAGPGSPEWIRARDAVERADEAFRPARAAFSALIWYYSQSVERTHGAEADFVVLARHVTEESLLGMTEHLLEQLERVAGIVPEHPQPFDIRKTN